MLNLRSLGLILLEMKQLRAPKQGVQRWQGISRLLQSSGCEMRPAGCGRGRTPEGKSNGIELKMGGQGQMWGIGLGDREKSTTEEMQKLGWGSRGGR